MIDTLRSRRLAMVLGLAGLWAGPWGTPAVRGLDCNQNGVEDGQDIEAGRSADCDGNGFPDECDLDPLARIFEPRTAASIGADSQELALEDMDGDGHIDAVTVVTDPHLVTVLFNDGEGDFGDRRDLDLGAGRGFRRLAVADFDLDGDVDIATVNFVGGVLAVFRNDGGRQFELSSSLTTGWSSYQLVTADADQDGDADILMNLTSDRVAILRNDGGLTFVQDRIVPAGLTMQVLRAGDLNGDGDPDVICAGSSEFLAIHLGKPGTEFETFRKLELGNRVDRLVVSDVDRDDDLDLVIEAYGSGGLHVLKNDGAGNFPPGDAQMVSRRRGDVAVFDFDGDGFPDLSSFTPEDSCRSTERGLWIYPNRGDGSFDETFLSFRIGPFRYHHPADMNGDGEPDLVFLRTSFSSNLDSTIQVFRQGRGPRDSDCNENGVPDRCELFTGDCNLNGIPDDCDIGSGSSPDCDADGIPDECASDCNENGRPDTCDLSTGESSDEDGDGVPDDCVSRSTAGGLRPIPTDDCNHNGVADRDEIAGGDEADCNGNGVPDSCDLGLGLREDCDLDGIPDDCEVEDCNENGRPDSCDLVPPYRFLVAGIADQTAPVPPRVLAAGDMDGDGLDDLLVAKAAECCSTPREVGSVWVLRSTGEDDFWPLGNFVTPGNPVALETADLDGDGRLDLLVANWEVACDPEGSVSVHLNQGGGRLIEVGRMARGFEARIVRSRDLDGDGDVDVALVARMLAQSDRLLVFLNDGAAGFSSGPQLDLETDTYFRDLLIDDLDADGDPDIAVSDNRAGAVRVAINEGGGRFSGLSSLPDLAPNPQYLGMDDLDADGDRDLVILHSLNDVGIPELRVKLREEGGFVDGEAIVLDIVPYRFWISDRNADGAPDITIHGLPYPFFSGDSFNRTAVFLNRGSGTFRGPFNGTLGGDEVGITSAFADFDGDGFRELVVGARQAPGFHVFGRREDGSFELPVPDLEVPGLPVQTVAADLDGDDAPDLVIRDLHEGLTVFLNSGAGSFGLPLQLPMEARSSWVEVADVDGDGDADLIAVVPDGLRIFDNRGHGEFDPPEVLLIGSGPVSAVARDFDSDGDIDLVTVNLLPASPAPDNFSYLENRGSGEFAAVRNYFLGKAPHLVRADDLDRDGDLDLVVDTRGEPSTLLMIPNSGSGSFGAPRVLDAEFPYSHGLELSDVDRDGDTDILSVQPGSVTLHRNAGPEGFGVEEVTDIDSGSGLGVTDLDGDGRDDLVVLQYQRVDLYRNVLGRGHVGVEAVGLEIPGVSKSGDDPVPVNQIATADFDGNGLVDLAIPFPGRFLVRVYLNHTRKALDDLDGNQVLDVCEQGEAPVFVRGDVDASGKRNITDPVVALRWLFVGDFEVRCEKAADVNDDGINDVSDAITLLEFLFINRDPLPEPQRECGRDPTEDALGCEEFAGC